MTPLIRSARDLKITMPGWVAFILSVCAGAALVVLVFRGVARDDLAEWGIVLGLFLQTISNLLTQAHTPGRATDTSDSRDGPP